METFTSSNLKQLFTYPFKDQQWQGKLAIAAALMFANFIIPILPMVALYGYMMRIIKQVVEGDGQPALPAWDDWGELLLNGLKLMGQALVFSLPLILLMAIAYGGMFFASFSSAMLAENSTAGHETLNAMMSLLTLGGSYLIFGLVIFLSVIAGFLQSVILPHVAVTGQFTAAFRFGEWWRLLRSNFGEFLLAYVFVLALGIGIGFLYQMLMLTIVLCCVVPFVASVSSVYVLLVSASLYGQVYRTALAKRA